MSDKLLCYRCGESLEALSLPFSRYDECPNCSMHLKVCRMCEFYDPGVPKQCTEDDAEEVTEKERLNFCDWFRPGYGRFDGRAAQEETRAKNALSALFGDENSASDKQDPLLRDAEDLFK